MNAKNHIESIRTLLDSILDADTFIVDIRVKPTNNFKIYLDADQGFDIDRCIRVNRALYKQIEEAGWYPEGDFSLEVSSPGIDEPLRLHRQYLKNIGRKVLVTLLDGSQKEGKMNSVTETQIVVHTVSGKGKKAVEADLEIPFTDIKQTQVQISFS
jgi:ribosome maturation factor RimP